MSHVIDTLGFFSFFATPSCTITLELYSTYIYCITSTVVVAMTEPEDSKPKLNFIISLSGVRVPLFSSCLTRTEVTIKVKANMQIEKYSRSPRSVCRSLHVASRPYHTLGNESAETLVRSFPQSRFKGRVLESHIGSPRFVYHGEPLSL